MAGDGAEGQIAIASWATDTQTSHAHGGLCFSKNDGPDNEKHQMQSSQSYLTRIENSEIKTLERKNDFMYS